MASEILQPGELGFLVRFQHGQSIKEKAVNLQVGCFFFLSSNFPFSISKILSTLFCMNRNIFSIHDYSPTWANLILSANRTGWAVTTHALGCDPNDKTGEVFNTHDGKIGIIARLNNGYGTAGTIPLPINYRNFAKRCANFVSASKGIEFVIIGNEIQMAWDFPENQPISLQNYMECYLLCYDAIKLVAPQIKVGPAPVATWSPNLKYPGNERGDWVQLQADIWKQSGNKIDALYIHAYSHGYDPALITDKKVMDAPFGDRFYNFQVYKQFMSAVPNHLKHLPVFITEMNGDGLWTDHNSGWIQAAYAEVNRHNREPGSQQIWGAACFRWAEHDREWDMSKKTGTIQDFQQSLLFDYKPVVQLIAPIRKPVEPAIQSGVPLRVLRDTKLRVSPGYVGKGEKDVILSLKSGDTAEVIGDGKRVDELNWLQVKVYSGNGSYTGWVAQSAPDKTPMIEIVGSRLKIGDKVETTTVVNVRVRAGKSHETVRQTGIGSELVIEKGPQFADGLIWWHVGIGWCAESINGVALLKLPKSDLVGELAARHGLDKKVVKAVLAVESGGAAFGADGRVLIRFEPHVFLSRLVDSRQREQFYDLFQIGTPIWDGKQHRVNFGGGFEPFHGEQSKEHRSLNLARGLNEDAAWNSFSMGAPQLMSFHHEKLGYRSAQEMFQAFQKSEDEQIEAFFRFLVTKGLIEKLRDRDFLGFAKVYNGDSPQAAWYADTMEKAARAAVVPSFTPKALAI